MEDKIGRTRKAKILIVDDVETNRVILEEIIKDMGDIPILAESGAQALEMLAEYKPQLVLTDISMPKMDGYELCRILKKNEATKDIPVVFISAFDSAKDIVEGFSLGGEDYITKPFIPEVIQARVGVQLRLHEVKDELIEANRRLQISINEQLEQIKSEEKHILYAMANAAAQNADYEKEYMPRLKQNCRILAQGMQLSPIYEKRISDTQVDAIELAVPLCDIGNIGIPKGLLQKEEGLTQEENNIMKTHTEIGAKLLCDLKIHHDYNDLIGIAVDMARSHHENWDGSGYPRGLRGEEIPLAAQIVSVMDRYCALTEHEAHSSEQALEIMDKEAGVKFNPYILEICNKISKQFC